MAEADGTEWGGGRRVRGEGGERGCGMGEGGAAGIGPGDVITGGRRAVGYTMCLQTALILQTQLKFFFPVSQFVIILVVSIICAFGSTFVPTSAITSKQIAAIFRLV